MEISVAVQGGGAERVVVSLARKFAEVGHEVTVVFLEGESDEARSLLHPARVELTRITGRDTALSRTPIADFNPLCIPRIARVARAFRPDLFHAHIPRAALWTAWAKRLLVPGVSLVYTEQNVQEVYPTWARSVFRAFLPFTDHVVCVSNAAGESFSKHWRWSPQHVSTIWNPLPIAADRHPKPRAQTRASLGISEGERLVLSVGNLARRKGYDVLINAIPAVLASVANVRFLIAGSLDNEPATAGRLRTLAADLGVSDRISFLGARDDVPDLLAASDLFVMSSRQEGFSLALLEAMAAEKPIVITNAGGCPEAVVDQESGLVVASEHHRALAAAMTRLLSDPALGARMGEAAGLRLQERFTIDSVAARYLELFGRLIHGGEEVQSSPPQDDNLGERLGAANGRTGSDA